MVAVNAAKSLANFLCPVVGQEGHIIKSFAMQACQTLVFLTWITYRGGLIKGKNLYATPTHCVQYHQRKTESVKFFLDYAHRMTSLV